LALNVLMMTGFVLSGGEKDIDTSEKPTADSSATKRMSNVIIILADDLGCGDISLYDGWVQTPRIDQMAREGVTFTDFHSNASLYSPTRAALLTGRYNNVLGSSKWLKGIETHTDWKTPNLRFPGS